jgi:hypothetical protein
VDGATNDNPASDGATEFGEPPTDADEGDRWDPEVLADVVRRVTSSDYRTWPIITAEQREARAVAAGRRRPKAADV